MAAENKKGNNKNYFATTTSSSYYLNMGEEDLAAMLNNSSNINSGTINDNTTTVGLSASINSNFLINDSNYGTGLTVNPTITTTPGTGTVWTGDNTLTWTDPAWIHNTPYFTYPNDDEKELENLLKRVEEVKERIKIKKRQEAKKALLKEIDDMIYVDDELNLILEDDVCLNPTEIGKRIIQKLNDLKDKRNPISDLSSLDD